MYPFLWASERGARVIHFKRWTRRQPPHASAVEHGRRSRLVLWPPERRPVYGSSSRRPGLGYEHSSRWKHARNVSPAREETSARQWAARKIRWPLPAQTEINNALRVSLGGLICESSRSSWHSTIRTHSSCTNARPRTLLCRALEHCVGRC